MKTAVLRADGSVRLGMGHLMRCIAFAEGLRERAIDPVFLVRGDAPALAVVRDRGYSVWVIPDGATPREDALRSVEVRSEAGATLLVTDLCHAAAVAEWNSLHEYHRIVSADTFTLCLTGSGGLELPARIAVSPYAGSRHGCFTQGDRTLLLGPAYCILRREFVRAAQVDRSISAEATKVLVTIGGADAAGIAVHVLRALQRVACSRALQVRVVVGPATPSPIRARVADGVEALGRRAAIVHGPPQLARLMLWCDLAVLGDGLTKYEAAATGTPSVMLSRPDSEHDMNATFAALGTTMHVGDFSRVEPDSLAAVIIDLLSDPIRRRAMADRGRQAVDGRGLDRILDHVARQGAA